MDVLNIAMEFDEPKDTAPDLMKNDKRLDSFLPSPTCIVLV